MYLMKDDQGLNISVLINLTSRVFPSVNQGLIGTIFAVYFLQEVARYCIHSSKGLLFIACKFV